MPTRQQPTVHARDVRTVRDAAGALTAALEAHLRAVEGSAGESDPAVAQAFADLREAFGAYDELLYDVHDEVLPFEVVEYVEDDEDPDDAEHDLEVALDDGGSPTHAPEL